jgi:glycerol-3-phosphate acyltransferase PlsX
VVVAASMVASGEADATVSLGNTAAAMAIATLRMGRIKGIDRPAIATVWPGKTGPTILLDAGAVADCTVDNLMQFAVMGSVYAEKVLSIPNPRVALLSIGEEKCKGNELTREAHEALAAGHLNFVGNVEGRHLLSSVADVVVTDGFTGNVALKAAEGLIEHVMHIVQDDLRRHPLNWIPVLMLTPLMKRIKNRLDYSEYGGAPLLGLNGIGIIGHGRSKARAVASAVRAAKEAVSGGVVKAIQEAVVS